MPALSGVHRPDPNQSVDPFVPWIEKNVGKSVYILGSDYAWPQKTADAISAAFEKSDGKTLGTEFFPFGTQDFGPALDRIRAAKPDVVWELFAGADAVTFIKQFASYAPGGQLLTNGLDEIFTSSVGGKAVEGIIVNQSYFTTLDTPNNEAFIDRYRAKFGANALVNSIAEATYNAAWLYARAVSTAGTTETEKVIDALKTVSFEAPQGMVSFDGATQHMATNSIIGRCRADGLFDIIENFGPIKPAVSGCALG